MISLNCCGGLFKGSTPSIYFNTNALLKNIKIIDIQFYQRGIQILEKTNKDITVVSDNRVKVKLSQEETLLLSAKFPINTQLRILYNDNAAVASEIGEFMIEEVLNNEVLG